MPSSPPENTAEAFFVAVCDELLTRASSSTVGVGSLKGTTRASSAKVFVAAGDGFLTSASPSTVRVGFHSRTTATVSSAKYLNYAKKELGKQRPGRGRGGGVVFKCVHETEGKRIGPSFGLL